MKKKSIHFILEQLPGTEKSCKLPFKGIIGEKRLLTRPFPRRYPGSENQSAAAPLSSSGGGDGVDYDDEEDNDSDDDVDDREKAKRRLKRTTAKYQKTTG